MTPYNYTRRVEKIWLILRHVLLVLKQLYNGNRQLPVSALLIVYLEKESNIEVISAQFSEKSLNFIRGTKLNYFNSWGFFTLKISMILYIVNFFPVCFVYWPSSNMIKHGSTKNCHASFLHIKIKSDRLALQSVGNHFSISNIWNGDNSFESQRSYVP